MATASAPRSSPNPRGRSGDGAAAARTAELFSDYGATVFGLCRALLRDRAEAEDAAQQTFLSAHRALLNGVEPREPPAWLATIARNECWARIKTRMREPLPTEQLEAVSSHDPVQEAIRRADLAALWRAIDALPCQQREALLLREFGGLSYEELAAALAVTGPAVESLLFRARTRLRRQLRAAYASLTGASWLEAVARIFVGGGAPVAAKVAALGVGAAAVTGGAVVTPRVLAHRPAYVPAEHHGPPATPHAPAQTPPAAAVDVAVRVTPAPRVDAAVAVTPAPRTPPAHRGPVSAVQPETRDDDRHGSSGRGPAEDSTRARPAEGGHETETPDRAGEQVRSGGTDRSGPGDGGAVDSSGPDVSGGGSDGRSGGGGDEGSGGGDGGRSGHGGGDEAIPTVSVPTVSEPDVPVPTEPSRDD